MLVLTFLFFYNFSLSAQRFEPIDKLSKVEFSIRNFGITVEGKFSGLQGVIEWHPGQLTKSLVDLSVDATSIETGIDLRDKHLKKNEFFKVSIYPFIKFQSIEITPTIIKNTWRIRGRLSIKGKTQEYSFPFKISQEGNNLDMSGEFSINRKDFDVGGNSLSMSDSVKIKFKVRFVPVSL